MTESGDAREDDFFIKVSPTVVSIQRTKKDEGSLEALQDPWYTAIKGPFSVQDSCTLQVSYKIIVRNVQETKFLAQFLQVLQVSCKKRDKFNKRLCTERANTCKIFSNKLLNGH